jgi:hypothetical protein
MYLLKLTDYVMHHQFNIQQFYIVPTMYLCVLYLSQQTATSAPYSVHWSGFITEMKSAYCAVRLGSLNEAAFALSLKGFKHD